MSGSNKTGGKAVDMSAPDNIFLACAKHMVTLEETLERANDDLYKLADEERAAISDLLMRRYEAEKSIPELEIQSTEEKKTRRLRYEAAGKKIDAKRKKAPKTSKVEQKKEDEERKKEYESEEKNQDLSTKIGFKTRASNIAFFTGDLERHAKVFAERRDKLLEIARSAQVKVDDYRDEAIRRWTADRTQRIAWGSYREEKEDSEVAEAEEDDDSLKELDVIEGSAKGKELKEPKNKVKFSKKSDQAHPLTLDEENEVNESNNELPPSKRRAVGRENASKG